MAGRDAGPTESPVGQASVPVTERRRADSKSPMCCRGEWRPPSVPRSGYSLWATTGGPYSSHNVFGKPQEG